MMDTGLSTLEAALRALRQAWPDEWPGLPVVVSSCLDHLGFDRRHPRCAFRIECLEEIARLVEADGATRAGAGIEPAYHNRLHVADTLVSLAVLIRTQYELESTRLAEGSGRAEMARAVLRTGHSGGTGGGPGRTRPTPLWNRPPFAGRAALAIEAMIAMVAHDYLHDGTVNRHIGQLEARSCAAVDAVLAARGLPGPARARIRRWIMATDPLVIADHHRRLKGRPFSIGEPDCLQLLINEADILVSSLPDFGQAQTEALASERAANGISSADSLLSPASRRQFLERVALFTSDASHRLGLAQIRSDQLETPGGAAASI